MSVAKTVLPLLAAALIPSSAWGQCDAPPSSPRTAGTASPRAGAPAPTRPSTPAPARAAETPATPAPSAGTPTGSLYPGTPGNGAVDWTPWYLWWEYNRDPLLAMTGVLDRIHPQTPAKEGAQLDPLAGRRRGVTYQAVYGNVVPTILAELADAKDQRTVSEALVALARIGDAPPVEEGALEVPRLAPILARYLADADRTISESAVLSLGILGELDAARYLAGLLRDDARGRELVDERRVPVRVRALAAYGLGLCGSRAGEQGSAELARYAVHHLAGVLETDEAQRHADLSTACVVGLGMVPAAQGAVKDGPAPPMGTKRGTRREGPTPPTASSDALVEFLMERFDDPRSEDTLRIHAPAALARLAASGTNARRRVVAERLIKTLERGTREKTPVQRSAVLALGQLGDSDEDALDAEIRAALMGAIEHGDHHVRAFAAISLAQVASRPGEGQGRGLASVGEVARFLAHYLARGQSRLKPWVGVALGVFGDGLREQGLKVSREVADALLKKVARTTSPEDAAAFSLAAGLIGDTRARTRVQENLGKLADGTFRGHTALALGFMGDPGALDPLVDAMDDALHVPRAMEQAAIGRALLGDSEVVVDLIERLDTCDCYGSTYGVTRALAWTGDHRALNPLAQIVADDDRSEAERSCAIDALGWIADKDLTLWRARVTAGLNYTEATPVLLESVLSID